MTTSTESIQSSELKNRLSSVLDQVAKLGKRFLIKTYSKEEAILVGIAEWRKMQETLSILEDAAMMEQIRRADKAIEEGDVHDLDEAFDEVVKELDDAKS